MADIVGLHEPVGQLDSGPTDLHRAGASLQGELAAR
jgi:hypothetical protein